MSVSQLEEILEKLPPTLKENKNENAAIHVFELDPAFLKNKYVLACKLPDVLSDLFINYADENKIPFFPPGLRTMLLYFYPEILGIYFDWNVIRKKRYWLYLPADLDEDEKQDLVEGIIRLTEDWLNGFEQLTDNKVTLPGDSLDYEKVSLDDLISSVDFDRIIIPFIGNEVMDHHDKWLNDHHPEINYKRHKKIASIALPTAWLPDHDESDFSLLSNPIVIKRGKQKFVIQYRLRMIIDNSYSQKRVNFYFEKTRIIRDKLVDEEGNVSFHPTRSGNNKTKMRTTYMIFHTRHGRKMIRVPLKKNGDKPALFFGKMTESYLRLNTTITFPNYEDVFKSPSSFHGEEKQYSDTISYLNEGVFIPYQLEDKGTKHRDKSGLSLNEHKHLFDHIAALLAYRRVEAKSRPISLENAGIEGGSIKIDHPYIYENKQLEVVILTNEKDLLTPIIKEAMDDITKMSVVKDTDAVKMMKGKFTEEKTSINRYTVKEIDSAANGSFAYLFEDLEFPDIGSFQLTITFTNELASIVKPLDKKDGYLSSTLDRIDSIKHIRLNHHKNTYFIIDMPKYRDASIDPKAAVKFAILEKGFLSHNIDFEYLKNSRNKLNRLRDEYTQSPTQKLSEQIQKSVRNYFKVQNEVKQKVRMTFYKIAEKEGFTNQMVHVAKNTMIPIYFADLYEIKANNNPAQYVYALAKYVGGKVYYKFTNQTEWNEYGNELRSLTLLSQKNNVIPTRDKFCTFLKNNVEDGSVLFFDESQKETYDELYLEYKSQKLGFELGYFTQSKYKIPYISRESENEAMFGNFLTKDEDYYFSMPPKPFTHQIHVHLNSQIANEAFLSRTALKIKTTYTNWSLIEDIHRLRNISLTYASYLRVPYPLHILQNTFEEIFQLNPLLRSRK